MIELPPAEAKCRYTGFKKGCRELVATGACDLWTYYPGDSPYKFVKKTSDWGCIDKMLFWAVGEAGKEADAGHKATTIFREMIFNPEYRERAMQERRQAALAAPAEETPKAIEAQS